MKRNNFIFILLPMFIICILLNITCIGINGNPLELTGTWVCEKEDNAESTTEIITRTLIMNDEGDYNYTEEWSQGANNSEYKESGTFIGNVSETPKIVTFTRKYREYTYNGVPGEAGEDNQSFVGTYYIKHVGINTKYLSLFLWNGDIYSGKYGKE